MFKQLFQPFSFMKRALIVSLKILNALKALDLLHSSAFVPFGGGARILRSSVYCNEQLSQILSTLAILCCLHSLR